ncbi:copper homeostasis protein CutC [Leifsonia poae]|uniref:PF03932 family protein CutC n=1 Tax=Leifsonia poae TaxID=110933 RepID=A0A9W6M1E9_9MICO|nr:copper homeostasis protein CutC [Leifsonia poae]GLJ77654.1 copper homeostasis protein CutC [Leifsonia poae]
MNRRLAVEIAVQDRAGVRVALDADADRIELCSALGMGGLTPSAGLIAAAVAEAAEHGHDGFVHVLVRPRGGGFVYTPDEVELTMADIRHAREAGASGVVVGALDEIGAVDVATVGRFVEAAGGLDVTFHRAIDIVPDPIGALEQLVGLGVRRILTSGGEARSIDGVGMLAALSAEASGRIQVMAGGGVTVPDILALAATGVDAVHLSARTVALGAPSGPGGGDSSYDLTDASVVRAAIAAAA